MGFEPITSAWKANHLPLILYSHQRVHPIKKRENPGKKSRHRKIFLNFCYFPFVAALPNKNPRYAPPIIPTYTIDLWVFDFNRFGGD